MSKFTKTSNDLFVNLEENLEITLTFLQFRLSKKERIGFKILLKIVVKLK